ncbi:hypothetical protein B0H14DRAFT_2592024 [Mycena olivaceomarginata]|nr:hypothetical protein B0H14DRAFT_2592024 [Mycena olivaceomarginata]
MASQALKNFHAMSAGLVWVLELRRCLAASKHGVVALPYIERCVHTVMRAICTRSVSAQAVTGEFSTLAAEMPTPTNADTQVFRDLIQRAKNFKNHSILSATAAQPYLRRCLLTLSKLTTSLSLKFASLLQTPPCYVPSLGLYPMSPSSRPSIEPAFQMPPMNLASKSDILSLNMDTGSSISVHESPHAAVFRQKTAGMFSHVSGNRIVVPFADLTFNGKALPHHEYIDLDSAENVRDLGKLASESSTAGLKLITYHGDGGCGFTLTCHFRDQIHSRRVYVTTGFFHRVFQTHLERRTPSQTYLLRAVVLRTVRREHSETSTVC